MTGDDHRATYFRLLNEVGIIAQLSRTMLEAAMPDGMVYPHFVVLNHLVRLGDGRTPLDLARAFQVPKTSMTHTLAGLERAGYVVVRPNPEDGRSKLVRITDEGRRFRDAVIERLGPDLEHLASLFPPERAAALLPDLEALRIVLDRSRKTPAS